MRKPAKVIAEIGCNHAGDMALAKEMVKMIKLFCDADIVKFQKRNPKECLTEEQYHAPHPVPYNSFGETYGEHREFLEFDLDQHRELKQYCESLGIDYATSVWDKTSALEIIDLDPKLIKVPSGCNTHMELLETLTTQFKGEIHLSLGMTTHEEEKIIVELFRKKDRLKDLVLYACTSGYPIKDEEVCLFEIKRLTEAYGQEVKAIGYSGHHLGIAIDVAAFVLGADYVERHFTLDRTAKGTDHAASLEPDGLRRVVRDIRSVSKTLSYKEKEILDVELPQREKLKVIQDPRSTLKN